MDRLKAMRQADWARIFGMACVAVGVGLSIRGYPGADWDALILLLGALMLFRAAVEGPAPSRLAGMARAGRVILFMFAFAAVNRAQTGAAGAVAGALGNWVLWAVAVLLMALPLLRRGLAPIRPGAELRGALRGLAGWAAAGAAAFAVFHALDPGTADLRALVSLAAVANALPVLRVAPPVLAGVVAAVALCCVLAVPGAVVWPVAAAALPAGLGIWLLRRRAMAR